MREKMSSHRLSYWKTTLACLTAFALLTGLVSYWLGERRIRVPLLGWTLLPEMPFLKEAVIAAFSVLALLCFMTGMGGLVCLRGDAKMSKFQNTRQSQGASTGDLGPGGK